MVLYCRFMTTDATAIILDEIALSLHKELGVKPICRLLEVFGDAGRVFSAAREELVELAGLRPGSAASLLTKPYHRQAVAEMEYCRRNGITPVGVSSPFYPPLLRECCDFPPVLYTMGNPEALTADMLAVVGTRKITPYGSVVCDKLVGGLASDGYRITVVSGLAYGVDATAHRAALANGLPTVAVLGNSLPGIYPADNTGLARKIVERGGCVVTEYDSGSQTRRTNFVARNRIIAGMSRGTLVVESPRKGGSMITAEIASGYYRLVMAVPGRITDDNSAGTNYLIRTLGAVAVTGAADIAMEMELDKPAPSGVRSGTPVGRANRAGTGFNGPSVNTPSAVSAGPIVENRGSVAVSDGPVAENPSTHTYSNAPVVMTPRADPNVPAKTPPRIDPIVPDINRLNGLLPVDGGAYSGQPISDNPGARNPTLGNPASGTLPPIPPDSEAPSDLVSGDKARILEHIVACDGAGVDMLVERTGIAAQAILAMLFELELAGMVRKSPGGTYIKIR